MRSFFALMFVFAFSIIHAQVPENISRIDPTGGGDYVSLVDWAADVAGNLTTRGVVEVAEVYGGGSVGGVRILSADGWVTDSTHFPWIRAATGQGHGGVFTRNRAYLQAESTYTDEPVFFSNVGFVRVGPGLTLEATCSANQHQSEWLSAHIQDVPANQPVLFDSVFIRRNNWSAVGALSILSSTTNCQLVIRNSVILHTVIGNTNWYPALTVKDGYGTITAYNTAIIATNNQSQTGGGCVGVYNGAGSITLENCYLHSSGSMGSFVYGSGVTKGTKDATSNGEALYSLLRNLTYGPTNLTDVTFEMEDFHIQRTSALNGNYGVNLSAQGVTKDFDGENRSGQWDVGPDQWKNRPAF